MVTTSGRLHRRAISALGRLFLLVLAKRGPDVAKNATTGLRFDEIESRVRNALSRVKDPEIPVCTIEQLGLIENVSVIDGTVTVKLLPTFVGCPALDAIRTDAERAAREAAPGYEVTVRFVYDPPWTTDRITEAGREALTTFGIAPPGPATVLQIKVRCPNCGSLDTTLESAFGPTACRTIRYCNSCRNPFEGFKPKGE
jgi:ring-1,2-phenylacetyl-CoA epoxidase subunit PaaD